MLLLLLFKLLCLPCLFSLLSVLLSSKSSCLSFFLSNHSLLSELLSFGLSADSILPCFLSLESIAIYLLVDFNHSFLLVFMVLMLLGLCLFNFDGCCGLNISSCLGCIFNLNNRLDSLWLDGCGWDNSIQLFIHFSFNLFGHFLCWG